MAACVASSLSFRGAWVAPPLPLAPVWRLCGARPSLVGSWVPGPWVGGPAWPWLGPAGPWPGLDRVVGPGVVGPLSRFCVEEDNPHAWAREYQYDDEEEKRTPGVGDGSLTRREKKEKIEAPQWEPIPERLVMSPKRLHISILSYP